MGRPPRLRFAGAAALALTSAVSSSAAADPPADLDPKAATDSRAQSVEQCFTMHESGQELRKSAKLLESRDAFRSCSVEACPALVRQDCLAWLAEVERATPSVTFEVVIEGRDVSDATITDGSHVIPARAEGLPYELNPGLHVFKAEASGRQPIESSAVIREGEQDRVILLEPAPEPRPAVTLPASSKPTGPRTVSAAVWVLAGISVVSATGGIVFGAVALEKRDGLNELHCRPVCTSSEVAPMRTMAGLADASFAGAAVFAALGAYVYFSGSPAPRRASRSDFEIGAAPRLGGVEVRGHF